MKLVHKDLQILSIKSFCKPSLWTTKKVNHILEENCKLYSHLSGGNNYPIIKSNHDLFFVRFVNKFQNTCERLFKSCTVDISRYRNVIWCYRSYGNNYSSDFHDHVRSSTVNAVYYHQINDGDGINFLTTNNEVFTYHVNKDELLIFPDYVKHAPNKPSGNKIRYSLNIELPTLEPSNLLFNFT
jgi:hypothetical protein